MSRPHRIALVALALVLGIAPGAVEGRGRQPRPPTREKLLKILEKADSSVYYLSREGLQDLSITFPKFTSLGWITRKMFWKAPGMVFYRVDDLPEEQQARERAYVGQLLAEFDGTLYALTGRPWADFAEDYDLSAPDPRDLTKILLIPKEDHPVPFRRKLLQLTGGLPFKVTTFWPPPPPTREELELDPNFVGSEIETFVEIRYVKQGDRRFIRRLDYETKGKKVIIDIERWKKRGKYFLPVELTLVDPFSGNEMLETKGIEVDQGLPDELFEGFPHKLYR